MPATGYPNQRDCEHGRRRGSCALCDYEQEISELNVERDELLAALQGMIDIANDSQGVAGYHLNGEVADWGEFEEWQAACNAISKAKGGAS